MKKIIQRAKIPWSKRLSKSLSIVRRSQGSQLTSPSEESVHTESITEQQSSSSYNDAVLVEISLNWTQEEENLVELFCLEKEELNASSFFYFDGLPSAITHHQTHHNQYSDELISSSFDPEEFIVKEYYSSSMREITVDLNRLEKDIESNIISLKSIVKKNFDQYLSAFTILQELHSLRLRTDSLMSLEHTLLGFI